MTDQHIPESQKKKSLGIAGALAKAFIHSPLSPMLLIACFILGIIGVIFTPRQEDPQISVPMVDIFVQYPGASSEEVASLVAKPLERIMSEIVGVKHVYSASFREQAMVTVQFKVGQDMEKSLVKLYDKLESNKDIVPPGVIGPLVKPKGVDDVPTVTLTLWSEEVDDATLKLIALETLQEINEVKQFVRNVGKTVDLTGSLSLAVDQQGVAQDLFLQAVSNAAGPADPGVDGLLHPFLDVAAHVLVRVELRFLWQKADLDAGLRPRLTVDLGVDAGHDAQQGGFAGAVEPQHADLGAWKEGQRNVAQDDPLGRNHLADAVHGVDVLRHRNLSGR